MRKLSRDERGESIWFNGRRDCHDRRAPGVGESGLNTSAGKRFLRMVGRHFEPELPDCGKQPFLTQNWA